MDESVRARVFDPFFTTKSAGRGLGLSVVLGVVRAHKAEIEVSSSPGAGSTFTVTFPPRRRGRGSGGAASGRCSGA
jgi:signal transduction histidine kinase